MIILSWNSTSCKICYKGGKKRCSGREVYKYYTKEGLNAKRGFQKSFVQNAFKGKHGALKASSENLFDFCFLKARVERLL